MKPSSNVLVSIIVPVYNAEEFLPRCIESILNQSYRNIECILVNDGSVDNSAKICDGFAQQDERVVCIYQMNSGVSAARNKGLDYANGDYICFVDSDDYVAVNLVEENLNIALETQADIVGFNYFNINSQSRTKSNTFKAGESKENILMEFFKGVTEKACWNKFYKKNVWDSLRFPVEMSFAEDWYAVLQAFLGAKKIVANENAYYFYNIGNETSIVHNVDVRAEWFNFVCAKKQVELLILKNDNVYKKIFDNAIKQAYKIASRVLYNDLRAHFLDNSKREELESFIDKNIKYIHMLGVRERVYLYCLRKCLCIFR